MCKVYTGYCGIREIEHGLCVCTVDNPRAKARGLSLRTDAQTLLCLSLSEHHRIMSQGISLSNIKNMISFNAINIQLRASGK